MEWQQGDLERAQQLFRLGAAVPENYQHAPLYEAWADLAATQGRQEQALELTRMGAKVLEAKGAAGQQRATA